jgi:hypothetical protein
MTRWWIGILAVQVSLFRSNGVFRSHKRSCTSVESSANGKRYRKGGWVAQVSLLRPGKVEKLFPTHVPEKLPNVR